MEESKGDMEATQVLEERTNFSDASDTSVDKPASAKGGRAKKVEETQPEGAAPMNGDSTRDIELAHSEKPNGTDGQVMKGLTVIELEMMPKMEDIGRLEEVLVGGTTNIDPDVIGAIAGVAVQSVEGVASLGNTSLRRTIRERLGNAERKARGVEVEVGKREVILDISIRVIYGHNIPKTIIKVRQIVAHHLFNLCGLVAKEINVRVTSIEFPERMPGRVQ